MFRSLNTILMILPKILTGRLQSFAFYVLRLSIIVNLGISREALRVTTEESSDLSRLRKTLYREIVERVVSDTFYGRFGLLATQLRSFWS